MAEGSLFLPMATPEVVLGAVTGTLVTMILFQVLA